jgi:hypothetical protein
VETEDKKYIYRVRLISNMYGADINLEMDFVFEGSSVLIYYAVEMDTLQ